MRPILHKIRAGLPELIEEACHKFLELWTCSIGHGELNLAEVVCYGFIRAA